MKLESKLEGEWFVDEAEKPIPPVTTWDELTTDQLIDVKLQLEQKLWEFSKNPIIAKSIQVGLEKIKILIASRL